MYSVVFIHTHVEFVPTRQRGRRVLYAHRTRVASCRCIVTFHLTWNLGSRFRYVLYVCFQHGLAAAGCSTAPLGELSRACRCAICPHIITIQPFVLVQRAEERKCVYPAAPNGCAFVEGTRLGNRTIRGLLSPVADLPEGTNKYGQGSPDLELSGRAQKQHVVPHMQLSCFEVLEQVGVGGFGQVRNTSDTTRNYEMPSW